MPQVPLNDLSRVDPLIQEQVLGDIGEILRSGSFLKGRFTQALKSNLSHMFGNSSITCVANGTDALFIALSALGVGPGTRVATVANAGGYTTGATLRLGALPVFIDVNPDTAQMSANALRTQLQSDQKVAVVVVTHLYGLIGEIAEITKVCQEFDLPLVEDCAQSFGASLDGKLAGTFGVAATFSFYPTKNLGAFGDAGAIATRDIEVAHKVQSIAQYGWGTRYSVELSNGVNSRIDEMQAAALVRQLPLIQRNNDIRRGIVHKYSQALTSTRKMIMHEDERFVGHLAVMLTDSRESDQSQLASLGISTGIHYPITDNEQPAWKELLGDIQLPNTDKVQQKILTLPCFPGMTSSEINQVVTALAQLD
jgi:dTDP-3-amino-2,3,6-trideoxy-4-keto-D-glucose/dTDP-3-amino-3,4,6-trideoxy-alpha-D-glucose/dTDP-2,6-dideoxy-D-kanosamine transaminase